jgi:MoaA/NifB/PqqE/SkfB family radical SAM enzyme
VYNHNYRELADFLDMAHQRKVDRVVIRFFKATQDMKGLVFSKDELALLREIVEKALQKSYFFKHDLPYLHHILTRGKLFENVVSMAHSAWHNDRLLFYDVTGGRIHCHVGWFDANIDEKGRVVAPCDNVGVCVAGNIYERRFKDIWFDNDLLHKTLKSASRGIHTRSSKWKECRNCGCLAFNQMLDKKIRDMNRAGVA